MQPQYDFSITVDGEKMLAWDILDSLTDYEKDCVIELEPGSSTKVILEGKQVKVSRPYPTVEEEMETYRGRFQSF